MLIDDRMLNIAKLLDVSAVKSQIHASNIANQNTPGYKTRDVNFDEAFQEALANGDNEAARAISAEIFNPEETPVSNDGNDVLLEREVTKAAQNNMMYNTYISLLRGKYSIIESAIKSGG